jgi:hypothetical protein
MTTTFYRVRKVNRRKGSIPAAASMILVLFSLFAAAILAPSAASASVVRGDCQPYSFSVSGDRTCLPVNRENTAWRYVSPGQYDRYIRYVRYCGRIGATQHKWGYAYRCTHLDDGGIWELRGKVKVKAGTPAEEQAACDAAWTLHQHQAQHAYVPSSAWWQTWRAADRADPEMRSLIHEWMRTGARDVWVLIYGTNAACTPDE